jgi:hypothetical protein
MSHITRVLCIMHMVFRLEYHVAYYMGTWPYNIDLRVSLIENVK